MDDRDIIIQELEAFNERLKKKIKNKKFHDTGKAANSLKVIQNNGHYQSVGFKYIQYLNRGTRPWKGDELKNTAILGYILDQSGWIERKAPKLNPYAVAYNIVTKGNRVFQQKRDNLNLEEEIKIITENLTKKLAAFHKEKIIVQLNEMHKNLKNVS